MNWNKILFRRFFGPPLMDFWIRSCQEANEISLICSYLGKEWIVELWHTFIEGNQCANFLTKMGACVNDRLVVLHESWTTRGDGELVASRRCGLLFLVCSWLLFFFCFFFIFLLFLAMWPKNITMLNKYFWIKLLCIWSSSYFTMID